MTYVPSIRRLWAARAFVTRLARIVLKHIRLAFEGAANLASSRTKEIVMPAGYDLLQLGSAGALDSADNIGM